MKRMVLFTGSTGLNTEIDPVRHVYSPETGVAEFAVSKNVDFDYTGKPSLRKGWKYTAVTGECHSLFCDGGTCLFVRDDALNILAGDFSVKPIRNVTVGARMSYAQIGDKIYYVNGREIGFVKGNASFSWSKPTVVHGVKDSTKVLSGPPTGNLVEYFNGRMYIVQSNVAWVSEQYDVNAYDLGKSFIPFEASVTMFTGVASGVWVGTSSRIVFLRGTFPGDFRYEVKGLFGVVARTATKVDSFLVGDGSIQDIGVVFVTKYGPCLGTSDGRLVPLSERKLTIPGAVRGAGVVFNKNYVFTLES